MKFANIIIFFLLMCMGCGNNAPADSLSNPVAIDEVRPEPTKQPKPPIPPELPQRVATPILM